jgi:hydroxypyruvate reductase/glycerate 2-kinase
MNLADHARDIWQTAVDAANPKTLIARALATPVANSPGSHSLMTELRQAPRILVLGGGKAGAAMSAAVEECLPDLLDRIEGIVNVPGELVRPLRKIRLHAARPAGSNHPTAEGVAGTEEILRLARTARPDDVALCLISGGGSALLPAPADGLTLADKQGITRQLHACGASINEMNSVRKHLSAFKGGRLAQAFAGRALYSLIISDVVGDPLDVIASGPTAADPTTFADALAVLERYHLVSPGIVDAAVIEHLRGGARGELPETLKTLPGNVHNLVIGNNVQALAAAAARARELGYAVLNLGSYLEGETRQLAIAMAGIIRSIVEQGTPVAPPVCLLSGGETTVTLSAQPGKGGRNQEFVLACLLKLGATGMRNVVVLSGGTDGEDGPTDAAGAFGDEQTLLTARQRKLDPAQVLDRHDTYELFASTGGLLQTGLTQTNVMDVRVILIQ